MYSRQRSIAHGPTIAAAFRRVRGHGRGDVLALLAGLALCGFFLATGLTRLWNCDEWRATVKEGDGALAFASDSLRDEHIRADDAEGALGWCVDLLGSCGCALELMSPAAAPSSCVCADIER